MINKNIGFKNKKMSQIKDILLQMQLEKIFLNNSYVHGLDCNLDKELKYFEF